MSRASKLTLGEGDMRVNAAVALLIISAAFSGCFEEDDGFQWPEPTSSECELELDELGCTIIIEGSETPHRSLINPLTGNQWILYLNGYVKSWDGQTLDWAVDLSEVVNRCHMEQGLLGMALEADFENTGTVLISYIEDGTCEGPNQSDLILASIKIDEMDTFDLDTLTVLLRVNQPYRNHNGGHLIHAGDNNFLWGIGDGGSSDDPLLNGQNSSNPLGTMYYVKFEDNTVSPAVDTGAGDPYVLHHGLRNPWRFDLDPDGGLWIADVGQACWEEVNLVNLTVPANLGWSDREGFYEFADDGKCRPSQPEVGPNYTDPVVVYPHENGNCSITGGFWMDWGPEILQEGFLYGDFCTGSIWVLREQSGVWSEEYIGTSGGMIVGFGKSLSDDLLVFHWTGQVVLIG